MPLDHWPKIADGARARREQQRASGAERRDDRGPVWRVDGAPGPDDGSGEQRRPDPSKGMLRRIWWVLLLVLLNWIVSSMLLAPTAQTAVSYTFFRDQVQAGNVTSITSADDEITGRFTKEVAYPPTDANAAKMTEFRTQRPAFADDQLIQLLISHDVEVNAQPPATAPLWQQILIVFGPTLLLVGLLVWFFRRASAGLGGGLGGLGRSKAKLYQPEAGPRTTFADVAGIDEVRSEVTEIIGFLKDPTRFRRLGAQIPKGVLLSGASDTGKTLLARAVAGEAGVPFFHLSASEFIEMIVGVGASRVRDLFD